MNNYAPSSRHDALDPSAPLHGHVSSRQRKRKNQSHTATNKQRNTSLPQSGGAGYAPYNTQMPPPGMHPHMMQSTGMGNSLTTSEEPSDFILGMCTGNLSIVYWSFVMVHSLRFSRRPG